MSNEFRNLVFEGGGVKGISYGGALSVLEKMAILPKITRVAGTSSGAITALLLSLGYSTDEVTKIIAEKNKQKMVTILTKKNYQKPDSDQTIRKQKQYPYEALQVNRYMHYTFSISLLTLYERCYDIFVIFIHGPDKYSLDTVKKKQKKSN